MQIVVENSSDARSLAQSIFDYYDNNLSMMDATDMPEDAMELAKAAYIRAKNFKESFE